MKCRESQLDLQAMMLATWLHVAAFHWCLRMKLHLLRDGIGDARPSLHCLDGVNGVQMQVNDLGICSRLISLRKGVGRCNHDFVGRPAQHYAYPGEPSEQSLTPTKGGMAAPALFAFQPHDEMPTNTLRFWAWLEFELGSHVPMAGLASPPVRLRLVYYLEAWDAGNWPHTAH